jgi:cystathionine beta-lyase
MLERVHIGMGNIFGAVASEAAYSSGQEWRIQMLNYVQQNIDFVEDYLGKNMPVVKMIKPGATYMIWIDFRQLNKTDKELRKFMIQKAKLGFNDGPVFGSGGSGFQRMNVACPRVLVENAMERLEKAMKEI